MKLPRIHRAWAILAGCCLLQGGSMGLINNCRGIFLSPVTADLGFSMGGFSFYMMLTGLCACGMTPLASRVMERVDSRVLLGGMSLVFSASTFVMGFFRTLPAFYAAGAVQGLSGAFLMFFPAPLILGQWFHKRSGLAIGICSAFSGVVGILGNPLGNLVIERFGWRTGYFAFALAALAMMLPVSVFLLRLRPADAGCTAYGEGEDPGADAPAELPGVPAAVARRTLHFWLAIGATLIITIVGAFNSHLSPMGVHFGYGARIGALLVSASMAGNVISKFVLGHIYDRKGLGAALALGLSLAAGGIALMLVDSLPVRLAGAFLYGFSMATGNIMTALVIKDVYGLREYGRLLSFVSTAVTLGNSMALPLGGWMVDGFGPVTGYMYSLRGGVAAVAAVALLYFIAIRGGRRLAARYAGAR